MVLPMSKIHQPRDCLCSATILPGLLLAMMAAPSPKQLHRDEWQKPDEVIKALALTGGETIFDVGAGRGYFTFRLAAVLPRGKVVAGDISPAIISRLARATTKQGARNVELAVLDADAPSTPPDTDLVFLCNVLHHVRHQRAWLGHLAQGMNPDARLAIIEFKPGKTPQGPPERRKLSRDQMLALAQGAGLELLASHDDLLPYQILLVFRKPLPKPRRLPKRIGRTWRRHCPRAGGNVFHRS
jgi:SAM-dependent methyltransferase